MSAKQIIVEKLFLGKRTIPVDIDELIPVNDEASIATAIRLAKEEGIFCGISAGATMLAALIVAEKAPLHSTFCVMLPDTGERYLSTPLFEGITEESDDAWLATQ